MAGLALLALLVAAALSAWWILTDRADFRSLLGRPDAEAESPPRAPLDSHDTSANHPGCASATAPAT